MYLSCHGDGMQRPCSVTEHRIVIMDLFVGQIITALTTENVPIGEALTFLIDWSADRPTGQPTNWLLDQIVGWVRPRGMARIINKHSTDYYEVEINASFKFDNLRVF